MTIPRWRLWLYRIAAVQFLLTSTTGLILYFRPLDNRAGAYPNALKEWLVMFHNGEWLSHVLFGSRYVSGLLIGGTLAVLTWRFALRALRKPPEP